MGQEIQSMHIHHWLVQRLRSDERGITAVGAAQGERSLTDARPQLAKLLAPR